MKMKQLNQKKNLEIFRLSVSEIYMSIRMNLVLTRNDMKTRRREMMNHDTKMLHRGNFFMHKK